MVVVGVTVFSEGHPNSWSDLRQLAEKLIRAMEVREGKMTNLSWISCSTPPAIYPKNIDGIAFYIGGDTPHVWTLAEIQACPYRYRLPIFVRSNPTASSVAASIDANACLAALKEIGAPKGTLVAWDSETSVDPEYIQSVYALMKTGGYPIIDYGSQSTLWGNENPDGYYWGADWTSVEHLHSGDVMTQWDSLAGWEDNISLSALPWWDTLTPAAGYAITALPPGRWVGPVQVSGLGTDGTGCCGHRSRVTGCTGRYR